MTAPAWGGGTGLGACQGGAEAGCQQWRACAAAVQAETMLYQDQQPRASLAADALGADA